MEAWEPGLGHRQLVIWDSRGSWGTHDSGEGASAGTHSGACTGADSGVGEGYSFSDNPLEPWY